MPDTVVKARIEKIAAGGAALAKVGGKAAFIGGGAPGETVLCRVTAGRRSWVQAELLEIVEASPDRVQPVCPSYGKCGGCNLQHLSYDAQIAAKTAILEDVFTRIGGFCPPQPQIALSKPWEYRNRMQFHVIRDHKQGVLWGLKTQKSSNTVPIADCPIADPGIRALMQSKDSKTLAQCALLEKDRFTVYSRNGLILSEGGIKRGKTRILTRDLTLDAGVFFQSNGAMLEKLITDLRKTAYAAGRDLPMADVYCGVGTFAAFLGDLFPRVDLVEENKTAIALARENLMPHKPAAFYACRGGQWAQQGLSRRYGFIVADPPRQGLEPALTGRLAAKGPSLLAYVSCDPATLARDSKILIGGGYALTKLYWYDFYPQTAHIESLAVFAR